MEIEPQLNVFDKVKQNNQKAEYVTTKDVFQQCLHEYTITHAIIDNNVLRFKVENYGNKTSDGKKNSKPLTKQQIVAHILDNHDKLTAQRRFNALLTVPSIPEAIRYYDIFKEEQEKCFKMFCRFYKYIKDLILHNSVNEFINSFAIKPFSKIYFNIFILTPNFFKMALFHNIKSFFS